MNARVKPTTAPVEQMCCVTLGFQEFLMPADKGMKLLDLMRHAVECEHTFSGGEQYLVKDTPRVEFALVKASQIRMPMAATCSKPSNGQALPLVQLRLK